MEKTEVKEVELELTNGDRVLRRIAWNTIENVVEKKRLSIQLCHRFPFVKIVRQTHIRFWCPDNPISPRVFEGTTYDVNCNLKGFAELFDVEYKSFSEAILNSAIKYGE